MLKNNSKGAKEYIEKIVAEPYDMKIDRITLYEVEKLTSDSGLRGLFYYKIKTISEKDSKVILDVDDGVRKICDTIGDTKYRYLTQCIGFMFDYSKDLMEQSGVKQLSVTVYTTQKSLCFSFTQPIGKDNLAFTKENDYSFFIKDLIQRNIDFKRNETIIDSIYTQTLEIRI